MSPVVRTVGAFVTSHLLAVVAACGLLYAVVTAEHHKALAAAQDKLAAAQVAAVAAKYEGVEGKLVSALSLSASQAEMIKALQKVDSRVKAVEQSKSTVTISDTPAGHVDVVAAPTRWSDDYHRFSLNLKDFSFTRKQAVVIEEVIASGPAGQRIEKFAFHEKDPELGTEIPLLGIDVKTDFKFTKDAEPPVAPWHPRAVFAVDTRGAVGGGVQANPYKGLTLGAIGLYGGSQKDFRGALTLGWRLRLGFIDTTISPNFYYGISSKGGGAVTGGAATIELTR